jgi:hypothetical protein
MKKVTSFVMLLLALAMAPVANADLVFSFRQQGGPAPITNPGGTALFDIVVTSTTAGQVIDGYDLALNIVNTGNGGRFTAFGPGPAGITAGGFNLDPFAPTASIATNAFTFTNANTTEYIAGVLTLTATAGSVDGTYPMIWDQGLTGGIGPSGVPNFQFTDGTYTLGAVPEPSGLLLGLTVLGGALARRRRV